MNGNSRLNRAHIFIGTNIDRQRNYIEALRRLGELGRILRVSRVYETAPIGGGGADFYNGAVLLETALDAHALKDALGRIEQEMGRIRKGDRYAPRTIDLDLVLYNHDRIDDGRVHVPDPLICKRYFLANALAELTPDYIHPENGRRLVEIADQLSTSEGEMRLESAMTAQVQKLFHEIQTGVVTHA